MTTLLRRLIADGVPTEQAVEAIIEADRAELCRAHRPIRFAHDALAVRRIVTAVCAALEVTAAELRSEARYSRIVHARWTAAALMRDLPMSLPEIARTLCLGHHATVMYGLRELRAHDGLVRLTERLRIELDDVFTAAREREEAA